jgi:hypothetical protein
MRAMRQATPVLQVRLKPGGIFSGNSNAWAKLSEIFTDIIG